MAQTRTILEIKYHYDDETGMYEIGELDFAYCITLEEYIKNYGREKLVSFLKELSKKINDGTLPLPYENG